MSGKNRNEQRKARELSKSQAISYNAALLRLRDQEAGDVRRSGRRLQEFFEESGFDLLDVLRGELDASLEPLAVVEYDDALAQARRRGLGLLVRAIRLAGLTPPDFAAGRTYATDLLARVNAVDHDGAPLEPGEAVAAFYAGPRSAFCNAIHRWLEAGHPDRLAKLAGVTWQSPPPPPPPESWAIQALLDDLDELVAGQMLDDEALNAVSNVVARRLIVEANS